MMNSDLHPPETGPNADPVLYGVAAGLAELFPLVASRPCPPDRQAKPDHEDDGNPAERS